jgi:hypothetical protein
MTTISSDVETIDVENEEGDTESLKATGPHRRERRW